MGNFIRIKRYLTWNKNENKNLDHVPVAYLGYITRSDRRLGNAISCVADGECYNCFVLRCAQGVDF